jgi:uncharacterized protein (TIGR03435 family)
MRPFVPVLYVLTGLLKAQTPAGARPEFEAASVKPNTAGGPVNIRPPAGGRFTATNANLKMLIGLAYKEQPFAISGGPGWIDTDRYDVTARSESNIGLDQLRPMLQTLLEDRFKLLVHREAREAPVYALMAAKNGPKLPEAKEDGCAAFGPNSPLPPPPAPGQLPPTPCGAFFMSPNRLEGGKIAMAQLVSALSNILARPVIDKTGFTGTFDVHLDFSREGTAALGGGLPAEAGNADNAPPSIFTAVQEQLGLKLESQKSSVQVLVIDHAEKASEN